MTDARVVIDISDLAPDSQRIAVRIVERLRVGQGEYGPWDLSREKRNLVEETLQELLDGLIYPTARLIQLERRQDVQGQSTSGSREGSEPAAKAGGDGGDGRGLGDDRLRARPPEGPHDAGDRGQTPTETTGRKPLTVRQRQVLNAIVRYTDKEGFAPSHHEIGRRCRIKSTNGVAEFLAALEKKGWIRRTPGKQRSIVVLARTGG